MEKISVAFVQFPFPLKVLLLLRKASFRKCRSSRAYKSRGDITADGDIIAVGDGGPLNSQG